MVTLRKIMEIYTFHQNIIRILFTEIFFTMNLLMIWFTIWSCGTSLTQMMIMNPTEIFKSNIIKTIKTHAITACWLECQQTSGCESFGPDSDNEKINDLAFDCCILGSREKQIWELQWNLLKSHWNKSFYRELFWICLFNYLSFFFYYCFLFFRSSI